MPSTRIILLVALLAVVAGTIALTVGDSGPSDRPGPSNNETYGLDGTGLTSGDLPSGVTVDGVSPNPLVSAHEARLADSTYTMTVNSVTQYNASRTTGETVYKKGETQATVKTYANTELVKETYHDQETDTLYLCDRTAQTRCPTAVLKQSTFTTEPQNIRTALVAGQWGPRRVVETEPYEPVELQATGIGNQTRFAETFGIESTTRFQGTARVDSRQVLTNLRIALQGTKGFQQVAFGYQAQTTNINRTSVDQPSWVPDDTPSTAISSRGMSFDQRTLYVSNARDTPYEPNTTVRVSIESNGTYTIKEATLDRQLPVGETLYVSLTDQSLELNQQGASPRQGARLNKTAYVVELVPAGQSQPTTTVEIQPPR
jgi:hypothetical protein